jgi:hypothetical protein
MGSISRAVAVWVLLMAAEVIHGVARTLWLAPAVGDLRARQIAVFSGSVLILLIASLAIRWLQVQKARALMAIGVLWVALTLAFELAVGRLVAGYSWDRLASDYDLREGGLLSIGLAVMAIAPWLAARFEAWKNHDGQLSNHVR